MTMDKPLILLLRNAEWQLGDLAFAEMRGHHTGQRRTELAETLTELVPLLQQDTPLIIDPSGQREDRH
jgi:hypothetical protein